MSFFFSYGGNIGSSSSRKRGKGDERNCHPRKDLTLQWRGNTGKLVKVRLKNTRAMEMWYNKQITEENIQEITTLNIIKMENLWH